MTVIPLLSRLKELEIGICLFDGQLKISAPGGKLTPDLVTELKKQKEEIVAFLQHVQVEGHYTPIEPVEKKEYYQLSSAQKRLYLLQQMTPESTVYNMPMNLPFDADGDTGKLETLLKQLISRHESLRTSFEMVDGQPVQRIHEAAEVPFEVEYFDLATEGTDVTFVRSFSLSRVPLLRSWLIKEAGTGWTWFIDMHHIITDGTSQDVLTREFMKLYAGEVLEPLRLQYKDFSQWQNSDEQKAALRKQEEFWLKCFAGELPVLDLPGNYSRPLLQSFDGSTVGFIVAENETRKLREIASEADATLYMVLLSIYNLLLSKLTRQEDIVVGTPIAGRRQARIQDIVGMFINTLAMRNYPCGEKPFPEFLKDVKQHTVSAYENQDYPFEELVEKVDVGRDTSRNPLFDVLFNLVNQSEYSGEIPTKDREQSYTHRPGTAKFDLNFTTAEVGGILMFSVEYCTRLFKPETIERFIGYFKNAVTFVTGKPGIFSSKLAEIEITSEDERNRLLYEFNETKTPYPVDKTVHPLFEQEAEKHPDSTALVDMERVLTYRGLNEKSNQLAARLREKGVTADTIVGIMSERSIEVIIGLLGILKAGGAYLPIDPDFPEERRNYLLSDSETRVLVKYVGVGLALTLEHDIVLIGQPQGLPLQTSQPSNLAYILYTSGSTGKPKGVLVEHRNVVRLVKNTNYLRFKDKGRILQTSALEFDVSTFEIWGSLLNGLELHLAAKEIILTAERLKNIIRSHDITTIWMTSALFNQMVDVDIDIFQSLRSLLAGGDVLSPTHINKVRDRFPSLNMINGYGPTENTTFSTTFAIDRIYDRSISIGKPIANSTAYILEKYHHPVPLGVVGELVLGGDGVARGYLNNPELTGEKFVFYHEGHEGTRRLFSPFTFHLSPLYKTGDLCRWLPDGNIEFLGRMDHQVKIRGFRIELEEIESLLLHHRCIKDAVVIVKESAVEKDRYICAYLASAGELSIVDVKAYLSKKLPGYMIPSYFKQVEKMPLTANGKIDRRALPSPDVKAAVEYAAPRDEMEEKLAAIWAGVLNVPLTSVGIDDNFFQLGGHSLKAAGLVSGIYRIFTVRVPLLEIFKIPTIRKLAEYIKNAGKEITSIKDDCLVLLKKKSNKAVSLFFVHDGSGEVEGYAEFCRQFSGELNCWGLRAEKPGDYAPQRLTIEDAAKKYIKKIKKIQPTGPYCIAGWSMGGTIAFEMVRQLEQREEKIAFFAMIDAVAPQLELSKEAMAFTLESEMDFIQRYLPGIEAASEAEAGETLKNINGISQLWSSVVDYLQTNDFDPEIIKKVIARYEALVIPDKTRLSIGELIKYLNMGRTLRSARALYKPEEKIAAPVHYFAAAQSKAKRLIEEEQWRQYCSSIVYHTIPGDHFSIFKPPHVFAFAETFDKSLKGICEIMVEQL